ncbi:NADH-quinone oxidoreductase subunit J [Beggiatoa leptomitoformis]|uniref:NADH-quinone oxidoreductase subunit J n=1 Tax=Beggiatoa leptomitoformis TaxID=288004 RepID=A0A2N9YHA5_9GAMM|nr:NADH-quinone oxidoreductase subunit J [Beggiatoa leptomitoformis]ALG67835.1 NADH-quinone oxidoreductase subunit J [Beggiatoa leptomitoformis]AUI69908.1 NADH-quinone oxidoreductase subunit J [Beggiatoa leptomitoformis]
MISEKLLFYLFALILVFAASRVISVRNPVHAAMFLVLAFFSSAAIWLLLNAEFLAIALVLVYVGAVMVLFLFVVMMLDINITVLREGFTRYLPIGIFVSALILVQMTLVLWNAKGHSVEPIGMMIDGKSNTEAIAHVLYTTYVYPFEIASVILLVAIIAAITLTMRSSRRTKYLTPEKQINVRREDRIRLVKMPAEKKD